MESNISPNNRRIAKNTILLYIRMLLTMVVSLYTSRVILNALGVENFGIYNVVGGLVTMFNIVSSAISFAISRFITFELGRNNPKKLQSVFSSAIVIQYIICAIIFLIAETLGLWFLNNQMSFPESRLFATNVIYQITIVTFCITLLNIPYNATIIAHERMKVFAYITITDSLLKLIIALIIPFVTFDKLIVYVLLLLVALVCVRIIYVTYCKHHFEETQGHMKLDRSILKEMFVYSGWTYIGSSAALLRDGGGNILINIFYGPVANAARGIGVQVQSAVNQFSSNFMTALNPQIVKNYALGNYSYVYSLISNGAKFSYYIMLIFALPILFNTPYVLFLWLKQVPEYTVWFVRLALVFALSETISNPLVTAASANGNIKRYQLIVGGIQAFNFPLSLLALYIGLPPYTVFIIAIILSQLCMISRLFILQTMINLSIGSFIKNVYLKILITTIISSIAPIILQPHIDKNFLDFIISTSACMLSACLSIFFIGVNKEERNMILTYANKLKQKIFK